MKLTIPSRKYNKWTAFHDCFWKQITFLGINTPFGEDPFYDGEYEAEYSPGRYKVSIKALYKFFMNHNAKAKK